MSNAALTWAFPLPITGPKKAVLIALSEHADDQGGCWPSVARIVLFSGVSERTVRTSLADLETIGLLRIDRSKGGRTPNRYWLPVFSGAAVAGLEAENGQKTARKNDLNGAAHAPLPAAPAPLNDNGEVQESPPRGAAAAGRGATAAARGAGAAPEPLLTLMNPQGTPNSGTRKSPDLFSEAMAIWNRVCGSKLTTVTKTTDQRRAAFSARLRDDFKNDIGQWEAVCCLVTKSDFLCGSTGFQATFDWVLKPTNLTKILEGNFTNRNVNKPSTRMTISEVVRGFQARASPDEVPAHILDIPPGDWHEQ